MRKLLACTVVIVIGVAVLFGVSFWNTFKPLIRETERVLALIGAGNTHDAYAALSSSYRETYDETTFTNKMKRIGMTRWTSSTWDQRSVNGDRGELGGTAATGGGLVALKVKLVYEGNAWKVDGIIVDSDNASAEPSPTPLAAPSEDDCRKLAEKTLLDLADALKTQDFTRFKATMSSEAQRDITPEKMREGLKNLLGQELPPIKGLSAKFDRPPVVIGDEFELIGAYPTDPAMHFKLEYAHENDAWKLAGISVKFK